MVGNMKEVKKNKKVLYHFVNFAIVNELLIIKNRVSPAYWLMQTRDEMRPPYQRRRTGSCLLQAAMATHERRVTGPPF